MVQFTIAYVALGFAILLVLGGILAVSHRSTRVSLSATQRIVLLGGLFGMAAFLAAIAFWLRPVVSR
jgi:hypothetical protein